MEVYSRQTVEQALRNVTKRLQKLRHELKNSILTKNGTQTQLQTIHSLCFSDKLDSKLFSLIVRHATAAEQISPGSFLPCIDAIIDPLFNKTRNLDELLKNGARLGTMIDVKNILNKLGVEQPRWLLELVYEALNLAGHAGKIVVEKSINLSVSLERIVGYTFKLQPAFKASTILTQPKIMLIDGFIESVSELNRVLQAANESHEPALIFSRGFHQEVINTLKINFDRGSLRIIPFVVPFDVDDINLLRDIATIAFADVVSADKGQLISAIDFSTLSSVTSATIKHDRVVLINSRSINVVKLLIADLRVRRMKSPEPMHEIYDNRIKSLTSNHVVMRLPNDKSFVTNAQFVDYSLRAIKSLVDHGVIDNDDHCDLIATQAASVLYAERCKKILYDLGSVILN